MRGPFDPEEADEEEEDVFEQGVDKPPFEPDATPDVTKLEYREFTDTEAQRNAIFDRVRSAYAGREYEREGFKLQFADVDYDPKQYTLKDEKDAVLGRKRLYWPLRGRLRLIDPEGNVVKEDPKRRTIAQVPYMTRRGTFVHNGNEYAVANQQRLRPGIYTRRQTSGNVESQFNVLPGTGRGFRIHMDPDTGVFRLQVGQSNMKLYPVLKDMGFSEKDLKEAWGKEIYGINVLSDDKEDRRTLPHLVAKLGGPQYANLPPDEAQSKLKELFEKMRMDSDVNRRTMGEPFERVDGQTLLASTKRILGVNRGESEVDERDDLPFQSFHSAEDFFSEHVEKDSGQLIKNAFWKMKNGRDVPPNYFTKQLQSVLLDSGVAAPLSEINPVEILDARHKILRLGEGGLSSPQVVPRGARGVQPTHFGFIDPIKAPECYDEQTEVMTLEGWKFWKDVTYSDKLGCMVEGSLEYHTPEKLFVGDYEGKMYCGRSRFIEYCVTPNHRMYVRPQSGTLRGGEPYRPGYRFSSPEETCKRSRLFLTGGHRPIEGCDTPFTLPMVSGGNATKNVSRPIDILDWCEFLGWYLSEGSFYSKKGDYRVSISQDSVASSDEYMEIVECLCRLPFSWSYHDRGFCVVGKQLTSYVAQFGKCDDKFIPSEVFSASVDARRRFAHALLSGDGRKNRHGNRAMLCTTSQRLATDFQRLMFGLGVSTRVYFEKDDREDRYLGCFMVSIHGVNERNLVHKSPFHPKGQYSTVDYSGKVYCATVPGGLLYVRRNSSCGFWCGNSTRIGLDMRLAQGVVRGSDGNLYSQVVDTRTGGKEFISVNQFIDSPVAFPGEVERAKKRHEKRGAPEGTVPKARAMKGGKLSYVPITEINYELPEAGNMFTPGTNFVPFASAAKGQRILMGSRMQSQALPLENPESPLVQVKAPGSDKSMNQLFAKEMGAVFAEGELGGHVSKVTPDLIRIRYDDGTVKDHELYNNHPFNQKCVDGSTRLFVSQASGGYYTGCISDYVFREGDKTLSVDKVTGELHWRPVKAVQRLVNDKVMYRVTLASGARLVVTEDHSLVTLGCDGLEKVEPNSLGVGKAWLPVPRKVGILEQEPLPSFASRFSALEFGQLVGVYLAEGSRANKSCHVVATFEEDIAVSVVRLTSMLGKETKWNGKSTVYIPTNLAFASWVDDNCGHYAFTKFLSRSRISYGLDFALGVIGGFFSGDGWAAIDCNGSIQVEAATRSEMLRDDLVFFAECCGLMTTSRKILVEGSYAYYIRIRSEDAHKVPWISGRKAEIGKTGRLSDRSFDVLPLPKGRRKDYYSSVSGGATGRHHHFGDRGRVPLHDLGDFEWGKTWVKDLRWDRVVAVEEVESPPYVYDLSADDGVFWANGVFIHNTSIHNTPLVQQGHRVKPGQILASSNYTDANGELALGKNLRVAYHMMDGMTHEDAVVVSESTSKKFSSEQLYTQALEKSDTIDEISKSQFVTKYPGIFTAEQLKTLDDVGVVKPGTVVQQGDPLILAVGTKRTKVKGSLMRSSKSEFTDAAETWEHETPGQVVDVYKTNGGWRVSTKTFTPVKVGDKFAGSYGNKGVVTRVVPDEEMPTDESGQPIELVLSPMGIISRVNPSQLVEGALGKVAMKTGKRYILPSFSDDSLVEFAISELEKNGLKDTETITDPRTGRKIEGVSTGVQNFFKLHHLAESKLNARSMAGYSMDDTPAKGGYEGAKRLGTMEMFSLLSHGATDVIRDAKMVRGQRNDDYWQLYRLGMTPPEPRISGQYRKFEAFLQGSGINLRKSGTKTQLLPMTDGDVALFSGDREITKGDTVNFDTGNPVPGGLFDMGMTGGADGTKWSFVKLPEPMPNPVMEDPIKALLGLTGPKFEAVLSGEEALDGKTGGAAIKSALSKLNVDREIATAKGLIKEGKKTHRDKAVKRLGILKSLKDNSINPSDLVMTKVPILPPKWRPVSRAEGVELVSDVNQLYKELIEAKDNYTKAKELFGTPGDTRLDLYKSFKAATGMGNPITQESQQRGLKGLLKSVLGDSPKYGLFQRRVIGQTVDMTGRGVIVPEPDYDIDEIGIPDEAAWDTFKPFIIREMVRRGMGGAAALKAFESRSPVAKEARLKAMKERPVIINRAPSLWKHNMTAHYAKPVAGKAIRLPIAILAGHNADFDGDAVNFHVPVSDKAVDQAKDKMLPSRNLYSAKDFKVHMMPNQGFTLGLYLGTKGDNGKPRRTFESTQDVLEAYRRGEIGPRDRVTVKRAK